jgi:peptidoglycan/LPS O-acetylase OafA/YrhL
VLSGFLIGGILLDARESPVYFRTFYARRFFRIMPLYFAWIGIFFALVLFSFPGFPALLADNPEKLKDASIYIAFLQNSVPIDHGTFGWAWMGALWSLAVEEQFYLVMPLAVRFLSCRKLLLLLSLTVLSAPLIRLAVKLYPPFQGAEYALTICRADALAVGVLLAYALRHREWGAWLQRHAKLAYLGVALLFPAVAYLALKAPSQYSYTMIVWGFSALAAFFGCLLLVAVLHPQGPWAYVCRWRFLAQLGGISYCFYVIHQTVNLLCHWALLDAPPNFNSRPAIGVTLVAAALTFWIAKLSWKFFEQPLLRRGQAFKYSPQVAPAFHPAEAPALSEVAPHEEHPQKPVPVLAD